MRDIVNYAGKGKRRHIPKGYTMTVKEAFILYRMIAGDDPNGWLNAIETAFFAGVEAGSRFTTNKAKREAKA